VRGGLVCAASAAMAMMRISFFMGASGFSGILDPDFSVRRIGDGSSLWPAR
jgi:hypothetical protein